MQNLWKLNFELCGPVIASNIPEIQKADIRQPLPQSWARANLFTLRQADNALKGKCHEIVDHFIFLKSFDMGPIWTGKNGFANFIVFAKNVCPPSQRLRGHGVSVVNDNANTTKTTQTLLDNF